MTQASIEVRGQVSPYNPIYAELQGMSAAGRLEYLLALVMQWKGVEFMAASGFRLVANGSWPVHSVTPDTLTTLPSPPAASMAEPVLPSLAAVLSEIPAGQILVETDTPIHTALTPTKGAN